MTWKQLDLCGCSYDIAKQLNEGKVPRNATFVYHGFNTIHVVWWEEE